MPTLLRRALALGFVALACLLAVGTVAQSSPEAHANGADVQGLLAAENQRFQDQIAHDTDALAREIADEARYGHVSGLTQSKAEYLHALQGGGLPYRSIEASERTGRVIGTVGITRGVLHMVVGTSEKFSTYLGLYIRRDGR